MKVVVDTNIVFSAIISAKGSERDFLIKPPKRLEFYSPYYLREEILGHFPKLQKVSKLSYKEVLESYQLVTQNIFFFSEELISLKAWVQAFEIAKNIDENDTPFVASAIYLKSKLWTGDKRISTLKKKNLAFDIINTKDLQLLNS